MLNDRKGVIMTMIAIVLAIFFSVMFSARTETRLDYKNDFLESRAGTMDDYMLEFFSYAEAAGSISGYFALQGVLTDIGSSKAYKPDFEQQYVYCVRTGNLTSSKRCLGMTNRTLPYFLDAMKSMAFSELKINSTYIINSINVSQEQNPFFLDLKINLTVIMADEMFRINSTRMVNCSVSIIGQSDPLFLVNSTYNKIIRITNITKSALDWNTTDLQEIFYSNAYRPYSNATRFINRLKGNFSYDELGLGIESFVNNSLVSYQVNQSLVDYLFFSGRTFNCTRIEGVIEVVGLNESVLPKKAAQYYQLDHDHVMDFKIGTKNTICLCCP